MSQFIYLDNHATTPCDPRVVKAMAPFFTNYFGNSSSSHHFGYEAANAVQRAREEVALLLNGQAEEIIFTSGATESNNLALIGAAQRHRKIGGKRNRIVTSTIEHKSILAPCGYLHDMGWEVVYVPVDHQGHVIWEELESTIDENTLLVSIQAANSEIGTIQPIKKISELAHKYGAIMHCDASQLIGKLPVNVLDMEVDLLSLSGHKVYGPKGVGALYLRGGAKTLPLSPLIYGGQQESGLRSGTLPVPQIVGLGKACQIASESLTKETATMTEMRDYLESQLTIKIEKIWINGAMQSRLPNNSSITFSDVEAEELLANLPEIALSTGSACESGSIEPSQVLLNIGLTRDDAYSTIRFGLGRFTTKDDIERTIHLLTDAYYNITAL